MTVSFIFSTESQGAAISAPASLGTESNTGHTADTPIYVRHDSPTDLYDCAYYVQPYSGNGYVGLNGLSADYTELLNWGTWGTRGLMLNQDANATDTTFDDAFSTATGHKSTNTFPVATESFLSGSATGVGHFPTGDEAHFTLRYCPPPEATQVGNRQWSIFMVYAE